MVPDHYILGGGVAGLILGWYTGYKIIDTNPLGQLGLRFIPGVRVIKDDQYSRHFCEDVLGVGFAPLLKRQLIKVGYEDTTGEYVNLSEDFKRMYSMKTRGKYEYETSFLSSGENEFYALTLDDDGAVMDPNDFYVYIFKRLFDVMKNRNKIISAKAERIDIAKKHITLSNKTKLKYWSLYSTIRLDQLLKICGMHPVSLGLHEEQFEIIPKHFYQTLKYNVNDENGRKYNYVYSLKKDYTRKTYFKDYIVYETTHELPFGVNEIDGNVIIDRYENVPLQIKNSRNPIVDKFHNIKLVGRFGQWHHSIKSNEIIKKCQISIL